MSRDYTEYVLRELVEFLQGKIMNVIPEEDKASLEARIKLLERFLNEECVVTRDGW